MTPLSKGFPIPDGVCTVARQRHAAAAQITRAEATLAAARSAAERLAMLLTEHAPAVDPAGSMQSAPVQSAGGPGGWQQAVSLCQELHKSVQDAEAVGKHSSVC